MILQAGSTIELAISGFFVQRVSAFFAIGAADKTDFIKAIRTEAIITAGQNSAAFDAARRQKYA